MKRVQKKKIKRHSQVKIIKYDLHLNYSFLLKYVQPQILLVCPKGNGRYWPDLSGRLSGPKYSWGVCIEGRPTQCLLLVFRWGLGRKQELYNIIKLIEMNIERNLHCKWLCKNYVIGKGIGWLFQIINKKIKYMQFYIVLYLI